jgi:hypothetical protein
MFSSSAAGGANTVAFLSISAAKRFEKLPKPSISSHSPARMPVEPLPLIAATLTFLLAGLVKGVIGLGLPTVSMGLLSLVMAPAKAASLLIVPSFVTNVWQLARTPTGDILDDLNSRVAGNGARSAAP